jgi:hypothetical protein
VANGEKAMMLPTQGETTNRISLSQPFKKNTIGFNARNQASTPPYSMDYTHDTLGRLSAQDTMMLESPHGTPVKKVR